MSYLEELLPKFRKGAKIRRKIWIPNAYVQINNFEGNIFTDKNKQYRFNQQDVIKEDWELYVEPIDWDYVIKNKCLCWFWDDIDPKIKEIGLLENISDDEDGKYYADNGTHYDQCRPVRRDEVTFYEDRKDGDY